MTLSQSRTRAGTSQVRTASCAGTACLNSFGDEQLAVDMVADKLLFEALRFSVSRNAQRQAHTQRAPCAHLTLSTCALPYAAPDLT